MQELIAPFINTFVFQAVWNILLQLTSDTVGRIFLVTVAAYFVAYSIYGGYITQFMGGISGFSLSRLGIGITDIITLFPIALSTTINLLSQASFMIFIRVFAAVLYFPLAFILGAFLGHFLEPFINPPQIVGILLYIFFFSAALSTSFRRKNIPYYIIFWVMQIVGIAWALSSPEPIQNTEMIENINKQIEMVASRLVYEFLTIIGLIAILIIPTWLGRRTAEFALSEEKLSNVESMTLRQPLNSLGDYKPITTQSSTTPISWKDKWFTKSIVPITMTPDVYFYTFKHDKPMYFIAAFNDVTVFFLANEKKEFKNGQAILISRDLIHSLEFRPLTD